MSEQSEKPLFEKTFHDWSITDGDARDLSPRQALPGKVELLDHHWGLQLVIHRPGAEKPTIIGVEFDRGSAALSVFPNDAEEYAARLVVDDKGLHIGDQYGHNLRIEGTEGFVQALDWEPEAAEDAPTSTPGPG